MGDWGNSDACAGFALNVGIGVVSANISGEGANKDKVITNAVNRIKGKMPRAKELGRSTKALRKAKNALHRWITSDGKSAAKQFCKATAFSSASSWAQRKIENLISPLF